MKKTLICTLGLSIFLLMNACDPFRDLDPVSFAEFDTGECHDQIVEGRFVIKDQQTYEELFPQFMRDTLNDPDCSNALPPSINFNEFTLLGYRVCGSGCETIFTPEIYEDPENMKYVYRVLVKEVGACEPYRCGMHWILVPTLPEGYFVEFL